MHNLKYLIMCFTALVLSANARPTFDVLYKLAQDLENELVTDTHTPSRDPYRPRNPAGYGYGPAPPPASIHYPVYASGHQQAYPGQYPSLYPAGPYTPLAGNPPPSFYPGPYAQYGHYPSNNNNYIQGPQNPYDLNYPDQYGSNAYGQVGGTHSYEYGTKSGYKNMGY